MRADGRLWGECISGALTEEAFLSALERSGFYGVSILKKTFWREVEGCTFSSVTVRGYKFEKKAGCQFVGQYAIYLGPLKAAVDEEGHLFPRGTPVEVCTDTASKLSNPPYAGSFALVEGPTSARDVTASDDFGLRSRLLLSWVWRVRTAARWASCRHADKRRTRRHRPTLLKPRRFRRWYRLSYDARPGRFTLPDPVAVRCRRNGRRL